MQALVRGKAGVAYNLGSGHEETNLNLVKTILMTLDKPISLIKMVSDRKGHDFRYFLDSEKTYQDLEWRPKTNFSEGIKKTIEYYESKSK